MEVMTSSRPNGEGPASSIPSAPDPADPLLVLEHIANLIEIALGAARKELEAVGSLLSLKKHSESIEKCAHFAGDSPVAIYAQKDRREDLTNGHDGSPRKPLEFAVFKHILIQSYRSTTHLYPLVRILLLPKYSRFDCLPETTRSA
jgi:hypothetical protein